MHSSSSDCPVEQRKQIYAEASHTASVGLGFNIFLVAAKLAGGVFTNSAALIADAVNSIGDVASSLGVRGALWMAQQEEDEDHPYGHTKAESIAALTISIVLSLSAGMLAIENLRRLGNVNPIPPVVAGIIAVACAVLKEVLYRYTIRKSGHLDSRALEAAAWDHRSDALCSSCVGVALLAAPYLGDYGTYIDPIAAICVCGLLVYVGLRLYQRAGMELMDQQAPPELIDSIRSAANEIHDVAEIEKLLVRKSGLEFFVEIHVEVEGSMTVSDGHRIGHQVKDRLLVQFPRVRNVLVHVEPEGDD